MAKYAKIDITAIKVVKKNERKNDFEYWQSQPVHVRLETLETIRREYHRWKYGFEPGFERVLTISKRA